MTKYCTSYDLPNIWQLWQTGKILSGCHPVIIIKFMRVLVAKVYGDNTACIMTRSHQEV